jgi:hypothetical protein
MLTMGDSQQPLAQQVLDDDLLLARAIGSAAAPPCVLPASCSGVDPLRFGSAGSAPSDSRKAMTSACAIGSQ